MPDRSGPPPLIVFRIEETADPEDVKRVRDELDRWQRDMHHVPIFPVHVEQISAHLTGAQWTSSTRTTTSGPNGRSSPRSEFHQDF